MRRDRHPRPRPAGGARHAGRAARARAGRPRGTPGRRRRGVARGRLPRHPRRGAPRDGVAALLAPRLAAARNVARRRPRRAVCSAAADRRVFWVGASGAFAHVLGYFQTIGDFGPLLTQRLLVLLFVSFFGRAAGRRTPSPRSRPSTWPTTSPRSSPRRSRPAPPPRALRRDAGRVVVDGAALRPARSSSPTASSTGGAALLRGAARGAGALPRHPGGARRPRRRRCWSSSSRRAARATPCWSVRGLLVGGGGAGGPAARDPSGWRDPSGLAGFAGFLAGFGATGLAVAADHLGGGGARPAARRARRASRSSTWRCSPARRRCSSS